MSIKPFFFSLYFVFASCFTTEKVMLTGVGIYKCQSPWGYNTAEAENQFRDLRNNCGINKCDLNQRELIKLSSLINNSRSRRHYQCKLGQNLIFSSFEYGDQKNDVLFTKYYLIDLTKGREYYINDIEDHNFYDSLYVKLKCYYL